MTVKREIVLPIPKKGRGEKTEEDGIGLYSGSEI